MDFPTAEDLIMEKFTMIKQYSNGEKFQME